MTSGRTPYRPEVYANDFYDLPLPAGLGEGAKRLESIGEVDALAETLFDLNEVEKILVDDAIQYGIPELLRQPDTPGRQSTKGDHGAGDALFEYCAYILKVMHAAGGPRFAGATVFQAAEDDLPLRFAAIHLDRGQAATGVRAEPLGPGPLPDRLRSIGKLVSPSASWPFAAQRVVTVFDVAILAGRKIPTAYLVKPDQRRFWTRSAALRDADALLAGGLPWGRVELTESSPATIF